MQRLKTRAQYEAAMAGGTVAKTVHFVLHRAALDAPPRSAGPVPVPASAAPPSGEPRAPAGRDRALFDVHAAWMGAVVPKRWAKRAVTRNGIKRQIYTVSAALAPALPPAAHVVRLRTAFAREQFVSAWSEPLKAAVRGELLQLFERAARPPATRAPVAAAMPLPPGATP